MDVFDVWEEVLHRVDHKITSEQQSWLMAHVLPVNIDSSQLVLQVQKSFLKIWLTENLLTFLQAAIQEIAPVQIVVTVAGEIPSSTPTDTIPSTHRNIVADTNSVSYDIPNFDNFQLPSDYRLPQPEIPHIDPLPSPKATPKTDTTSTYPISEMQSSWKDIPINPHFTFDNFIVGNSNLVAVGAAQSVAKNPAQKQNPLFIYGPSGLGKTHLMHAIRNYVLTHQPDKKIIFLSSEDFLINFIHSLQQKGRDNGQAFREKYRSVDYILIDDIQFFGEGGKETTRMEFFHTFNELLNNQKQIVMTCDRLPSDMTQLESRLRSRFQSGLVVEIQRADFEMRCAFLNRSAMEAGLDIPFQIVQFIAQNFDENFRDLGGIFTTLLTHQQFHHEPLTLEWVKKLLADRLPKQGSQILTSEHIIAGICDFYSIRRSKLIGNTRPKNIAFPRQIAMYLCREMLNLSYAEIGHIFNRDHSTVIHAYEKIYRELHSHQNPQLEDEIKQLEKQINPYGG